MKRITLIVAAVLMAGIFAGCATTSGTTGKKGNNSSIYDERKENIERIYAPTVTSEQFEKAQYSRVIDTRNMEEILIKHSSKTERKNFSGKITNETNRTAHIRIYPRYNFKSIEGELPDVNISIPPHETYYFIIENFFTLGQNMLGISELDNPESKGKMGYPFISIKDNAKERCYPVAEETLKTHSLEVIYNCEPYATDKNDKTDIKYQFVEPFDDKIKNEKKLVIIHQ